MIRFIKTKSAAIAAAMTLLSLHAYAGPEIAVTDDTAVVIWDGSSNPSQSAGTDFGHVAVTNAQRYVAFTIWNVGDQSLVLNGPVTISGTHAADFAIDVTPTSPVTNSTAFTIRFDPSAPGVRNATVAINSNDANEGIYTFAISGTGNGFLLAAPDIVVTIPKPPKAKLNKKTGNLRVSGKFQYQNIGPVAMESGIAQVFISQDRVLDPQEDTFIQQLDLLPMAAKVGEKVKTKKLKFKTEIPQVGPGYVFVRVFPLPFSVQDLNWKDNVYVYLYTLPL